jgi:hypothetical protein
MSENPFWTGTSDPYGSEGEEGDLVTIVPHSVIVVALGLKSDLLVTKYQNRLSRALQAGGYASLLALLAMVMLGAPIVAHVCDLGHQHNETHKHNDCVSGSALVGDVAPASSVPQPLWALEPVLCTFCLT